MSDDPRSLESLTTDAKNRAFRAFLVALTAAIFVDVWPLVSDALSSSAVEWFELGKAGIRVGIQSAGAFILRRILDPSGVPTPLPPDVRVATRPTDKAA